jgi:phage-related protein
MSDDNSEYNIELYDEQRYSKNTAWSFLKELSLKKDKRSKNLFNAIIHKINLLRQLGPILGEPHVKTIKGSKYNLKEIRVEHVTGYHRIFFCGWYNNTYVILNHFIKDTPDTPLNEIILAENIMDEWVKLKGGI